MKVSMKWFIYNFFFSIAYVCLLPKFLYRMWRRGGYANRFADRFGFYPPKIERQLTDGTKRIWIHAVSVGEVFVAHQMIRTLRELRPDVRFVLSTTSSTGWVQAEKGLIEGDVLIHNPLDYPGCVRRALEMIRPQAFIVTETELWPNIIRLCHKRGVPLFLINARISDRSAPGYKRLKCWFGPVLNMFTAVFAQSDLDRKRLMDAGCDEKIIKVTGSMKFDVAVRNPEKETELENYFQKIAFPVKNERIILLGGSTWPGEDEVLARIFQHLSPTFPQLRLIIAPRHFEKADAVEANLRKLGLPCIRKSRQLPDVCVEGAVLLADTTGELMGFYGLSDITFVGKSLCEHGAQNMIEPCLCGNATLVGPNTENFRSVMADLLSADALVQIQTEEELEKVIQKWLREPAARLAYGERAIRIVEKRRGITKGIAERILGIVYY